MPLRAPRPCTHSRCKNLQPCADHPRHRALDQVRGSSTSRGYGRRGPQGNWRRKSERLRQQEPLCRCCRAGEVMALVNGEWRGWPVPRRLQASAIADHIIPKDDGGDCDWPANQIDVRLLELALSRCEALVSTAEGERAAFPRFNAQPICRDCHAIKSSRERPRR